MPVNYDNDGAVIRESAPPILKSPDSSAGSGATTAPQTDFLLSPTKYFPPA